MVNDDGFFAVITSQYFDHNGWTFWVRTRFDFPLKYGVELVAEIYFVCYGFLAHFRVDWTVWSVSFMKGMSI